MKIVKFNSFRTFMYLELNMEEQYLFDSPLECINRAIRGLDRKADRGLYVDEKTALDALQTQFTSFTRDELSKIYNQYGVIDNFQI